MGEWGRCWVVLTVTQWYLSVWALPLFCCSRQELCALNSSQFGAFCCRGQRGWEGRSQKRSSAAAGGIQSGLQTEGDAHGWCGQRGGGAGGWWGTVPGEWVHGHAKGTLRTKIVLLRNLIFTLCLSKLGFHSWNLCSKFAAKVCVLKIYLCKWIDLWLFCFYPQWDKKLLPSVFSWLIRIFFSRDVSVCLPKLCLFSKHLFLSKHS